MFKRILIANRGEIAARIIRTARAMGIETVAVYSQADATSPHLRLADASVCIGPAPSTFSYLNMEAILQAAIQNDCQAVHPGFGFLAENALFAALCEQYKLSFIGPSAQAVRCMGDKALARDTMKRAGLDVIPGSDGTVRVEEEALAVADSIGFPLLLKATAGGGGKGMRICHSREQFNRNFTEASQEAEKAFANPALYFEKYIENGRHIEFQVLADNFGNAVHLGERECSVQRNHQKLIEESPSPALLPEMRRELGQKVVEAIRRIGYRNAGTVEFFMDGQKLYFMEMNTRLQVEHPVSEMVTGIDIVARQLQIAANGLLALRQEDIAFHGHAIECRINAEDPENNFKPGPGEITRFRPPHQVGPGKIRLDTFVEEGYRVPPFYDSMIGKLIAWGETREQTLETMHRALKNFEIAGVPTTISLHLKILESDAFRSGNYHTGILQGLKINLNNS